MLKKTIDTLTMTSNNRHIITQTYFMDRLTQLDLQCNWTRTTDKEEEEEERKSPRFAFLKISAKTHLAHLQSRTNQPTSKALQKSQILPTLYF